MVIEHSVRVVKNSAKLASSKGLTVRGSLTSCHFLQRRGQVSFACRDEINYSDFSKGVSDAQDVFVIVNSHQPFENLCTAAKFRRTYSPDFRLSVAFLNKT